jgi:RNA polymerase sigma-70 factor (ECF subfamily)
MHRDPEASHMLEACSMSDIPATTIELEDHLRRMNTGDRQAREQLFRHVSARLERLARKMLRQFPSVQRWCQTDDVLQGALARLLRSLEQIAPASLRELFALSTTMIRRELIDLARHFTGPEGLGANHASQQGGGVGSSAPANERADMTHDPAALALWSELHEKVKDLPADERETFDLLFYQELTQSQAAQVLGVSERTVQRRWQAALLQLHELTGGRWPGG